VPMICVPGSARFSAFSAVVTPKVTPWTIGQGLLIGVAIGVLGGLYPAWRGTRGSATELLGGA
jgi:ABC-type antimicrobial peptide transport system permease subunit